MSGNSSEQQEIEVKDFVFKQMRRLRVFKSPADLMTPRASLVAVSNLYGLIYVAGDNDTLKVIQVATLEKIFIEVQGSLQVEEENYPSASIEVGYPFTHIALSCDDLTMAVGYKRNDSCALGFLDIRAFFSSKTPKKMFCEVVLSEEVDVKIRDIAWNTTLCGVIAVLLTNGTLVVIELDGIKAIVVGEISMSITAVSWSPKGKQIVAGCKDGSLVQLTAIMEKKRDIPAPSILGESCEVSDLVWISNYHFGAVFSTCDDSGDCSLIMISAPKSGPHSFAKFDDVYYGMSEGREACFYLKHIAEWKMVLSIYADAYEVVTVGGGEGSWMKWNLPDSAQVVLPTTHGHDETFPLGLGISFNATQPIKQDDQTHPAPPILILLSTDGILCPFYMVNKNPTAPNLAKPAKQLVLEEERLPPISPIKPGNTGEDIQHNTGIKYPPNFSASSIPQSSTPSSNNAAILKETVPLATSQKKVKPSAMPPSIPPSIPPSSTQPTKPIVKPNDVAPSSVLHGKPSSGLMKGSVPAPKKQEAGPSNTTSNVFVAPSNKTQTPAPFVSSEGTASPHMVHGSETRGQLATSSQTESTPRDSFNTTRETVRTVGRDARQTATEDFSKIQQREKMPRDLSPSKKEQFEASFQKHIHNEVEAFNKEMMEMRKRVNYMKKIDTTLKELNRVTNDTRYVGEVNSTVQELNADVQEVKSAILEAFEHLEDAKIRDGRGMDASYLHLLKGRGLDPGSQRKMKDIRSSYLLLDNTLREVNMALDEKWEKENKKARSLKTPTLEFIYQTMRQNQRITRNQVCFT